jgi:anti-anti-sigma regulatory factor
LYYDHPWTVDLTRLSRVCLTVKDGLAMIEVCGVFDVGAATAVRAEFHEVGALSDAVLLDLGAVTSLEEGFDLAGFVDEIQRHCWLAGCRLQLIATHPTVVAALAAQGLDA